VADLAIRVDGLGKRYAIGESSGRGHRWLAQAMRRVSGRRGGNVAPASAGRSSIWAIRDISFEVERGEVVGVVGRNGAGKSTLLKILSRIVRPDTGCAEIHGRIGSLLEVGTGFHPELTGRDNIFLNGAILGMRKSEIVRKFDEIIAFAGIEQFVDTPVKHYSSGMYVRLAFAVAAHLEPEVLLVDEVLAVGDVAFQNKCLDRIGEVTREGRTVLFVSHNLSAITRLCSHALWIDGGYLKSHGPCDEVVSGYLMAEAARDGHRTWEGGVANPGVTEFKFRAVRIRDDRGRVTGVVGGAGQFAIEIDYEILERLPYCRIGLFIDTGDGVTVLAAYDADDERYAGPRDPGAFTSTCFIPGELLNPGRFLITPTANILNVKHLAKVDHALSLEITASGAVGAHMMDRQSRRGIIRPRFRWQIDADPAGPDGRSAHPGAMSRSGG
jgi:lipopolysaccharide transport system ATP-binding protein